MTRRGSDPDPAVSHPVRRRVRIAPSCWSRQSTTLCSVCKPDDPSSDTSYKQACKIAESRWDKNEHSPQCELPGHGEEWPQKKVLKKIEDECKQETSYRDDAYPASAFNQPSDSTA